MSTIDWKARAERAEQTLIDIHRYLYPERYDKTDPVDDHPHYDPDEDECFEWRGADTMQAVAEWIDKDVLRITLERDHDCDAAGCDPGVHNEPAPQPLTNHPSPREAVEWLLAEPGHVLDIEWGTKGEDPAGILYVSGDAIWSRINRGWSAGVVEPVCSVRESDFLLEYLLKAVRVLRRHAIEGEVPA